MKTHLGVLAAVCFVWGPAAAQAQLRVEAEAIAGKPFGVGVVSIQAPRGQQLAEPSPGQVGLIESAGRAFYPAFEARQAGQLVRNLLGNNQLGNLPLGNGALGNAVRGGGPLGNLLGNGPLGNRRRLTVYFLFTGDAPLDLTVYTPQPLRQRVAPRQGNAQQLFTAWWREFSRPETGDPYPQVHTYLVDTLSRRLGVPPAAAPKSLAALTGGLSNQLVLLTGGESTRQSMADQILLSGAQTDEPLDVELPAAPPADPATGQLSAGEKPPAIEPIAMRVPEECLYVRAGSFPNFLWFRHRLEAWGGNVRNLISEQAVDYGLNSRFERQMGLKESALAPVVGPAVIADVAIIGTDTFLRDGGAMGILFQARNNLVLGADIQRQRSESLKAMPGATEEKLSIAGKEVSLVSTPDNALRSFYVADGDFHLVCTSRALVQRFLETGSADKDHAAGATSLGASAEFRLARTNLPLERDDTIFVYLSRAFFRNLMSPRYQVEMLRRLRSSVEMELVELARLAARSEGHAAVTIEELIAADVLPSWFGRHADGSRLTLADGRLADTVRGVRGGFIPIPDVPLERITRSEAAAYDRAVTDATAAWGELDPVIVGIRRSDSARPGLEHMSLDIQAAPLGPSHYAKLNKWLGPPAEQRLAPVASNLVDVQASVRGGALAQGGDHYLFLGLQDSISADLGGGDRPLVGILKLVTGQSPLRGYLGAWPQPGWLGLVGGASDIPPDAAGYARLRTGVWRRTFDRFTLLSFHREVLEQASPELRWEASPHPSQLRAHVADLQGTNLAQWVNQQGYKHAQKMSLSNTQIASLLAEQFRVPDAESLAAAETVLDAQLVDPLGGKYELVASQAGTKQWVSSKLAGGMPTSYQFPALTWIRGLDLEGRLEQGQIVLHAEVEMPLEISSAAYTVAKPQAAATRPAPGRPEGVLTPPPRPTPGPPAPGRPIRGKAF